MDRQTHIQMNEGHFYSPPPPMSDDKNPDPSYKMDLDFLGLFRKGKTCYSQISKD